MALWCSLRDYDGRLGNTTCEFIGAFEAALRSAYQSYTLTRLPISIAFNRVWLVSYGLNGTAKGRTSSSASSKRDDLLLPFVLTIIQVG